MHGAAIVPYDDVASLPLVPVLGVGLQHVPVKLCEQPIPFRFRHADNADDLAGLREAIDVIKRGRAALDKQYHDLVPRGA